MSVQAQQETRGFQAEVTQLMELVAKSLYSNPEIFLRELISNASDASDRLRREALSQESLYEGDGELKVQISVDKDNKTLILRDNGIGMSREEIIEHLGTIAKSGTRAFKALLEKKDQDSSELIGQFGVGFYSAFVVADKVVVCSRRAGSEPAAGVEWESDGKGEYTVQNREQKERGTEITLHLKDSAKEFLEEVRLKTIIRKYSDHISLPIYVGEEQVNTAKALWTCSKAELGPEADEQYKEFYKHISRDFEPPLAWAHNKVEGGKLTYTSLLYIPSRAPFDLWMREHRRGLKLYVKRVFIMDNAQDFIPTYLRFVHGVIDSSDLPLNISRELLQSNKDIDVMRAACVKRILGILEKMAKEETEKYTQFWNTFGEVLKEGPAEDFANKDRIAHLLRFASTQTGNAEQSVGLEQYIERMPAGQKAIYYLIADNYIAAKSSPLLEVFRKKGIEVLLLSDRVDEWLVSSLQEFSGKPLQSIAKGDLDLGDLEDKESKAQQEDQEKDFSVLLEQIQKQLEGRVKSVRLTHRLTDSPACVVFDNQDLSGHMQRLLKASGQEISATLPILELNPAHVLLQRLKLELDAERIKPWANMLLGQALLAEGEPLKDPAEFVRHLNNLLSEV